MKLKQLDTVWRTIFVNIPQAGTGFSREKMSVEYAVIDQDELKALVEADDDDATLERVFVNFKGISLEDGTAIESNDEGKALILNKIYIRTAIIQGFFDAMRGGKRKN